MRHMNLAHRLPWYQDCTIITIEPTECSRPICGIPVQISLTGPGIGEGCQGWMGAMKAHFSCTGRLTRISGVLCVAAAFLYASAGGSAQSHNRGASQSQTQTPPGAGKTGVPFSAPGGTQNFRQSGSNSPDSATIQPEARKSESAQRHFTDCLSAFDECMGPLQVLDVDGAKRLRLC